mmetsp:Transcript_17343/g.48324  ORF Transcript_17343/g.48324 Transcript_17343/m.48324 type:complete len:229 (-) Transcript_17343:607-1293(-)
MCMPHTLRALARVPEARYFPEGDHVTAETSLKWPAPSREYLGPEGCGFSTSGGHILIEPSPQAVARPEGDHAMSRTTTPPWSNSTGSFHGLPLAGTGEARTASSSPLDTRTSTWVPLASRWSPVNPPSGSQRRAVTALLWSASTELRLAVLPPLAATAHRATVPSSPPEASQRPEGDHASLVTGPEWPPESCWKDWGSISWSSETFHTRTIPSWQAEASCWPEEDQAT